jgi:hypothetical protein
MLQQQLEYFILIMIAFDNFFLNYPLGITLEMDTSKTSSSNPVLPTPPQPPKSSKTQKSSGTVHLICLK